MPKRRDLTPVSYLKYTQVSGYTRKDGRHILPYLRAQWVVEFPVPLEELDLKDFGREKFAPKPTKTPTRKAVHGRDEWMPVGDFIAGLYDEYDFFEMQDAIYRVSEAKDVISTRDGLVWDSRIKVRSFSKLGIEEAWLVRVWILLYNRNKDEYFVFARARSLRLRDQDTRLSFDSVYAQALEVYDDVVSWAEEHTDYIEVRQLLAWTFWYNVGGVEEKAPKRAR
jgi:hypothetical protein